MQRFLGLVVGLGVLGTTLPSCDVGAETPTQSAGHKPVRVNVSNLPEWQQGVGSKLDIYARFVSGKGVQVLDTLLADRHIPQKSKTAQQRLERDIYIVGRIQPRELLRHRVLTMTLRVVKPQEARRHTIELKGSLISTDDCYYFVSRVIDADLVPKSNREVYLQRLLTANPEFGIVTMTVK
jgi:hypothetical protein